MPLGIILTNRTKIILALSSGILMGLSHMPKVGLWWLAWFALVPLLAAVENLSKENAFLIGMLSGVTHFFLTINWLLFTLKTYSGIPLWQCVLVFILLLCYLSIYTALFSVIVSCLGKKPHELLLVAPASWVLLEFLRGVIITGFPWGFIGYTQFRQLNIVQIADLFGVYGVSFLLVIFNSFIYIFISFLLDNEKRVRFRTLMSSCIFVSILLGSTTLYGYWRISELEQHLSAKKTGCLKIGVVQGNIDQSIKWDSAFQTSTIKKYIMLSKTLKQEKPDLIVWPETATPFFFEFDTELTNLIIEAVQDVQSDFIIGSPSIQSDSNDIQSYYNSAYLVRSNGEIKGRYDKSHLVPFGEYFPFKIPWLVLKNSFVQPYDFSFGTPGKILLWKPECNRLGLQICYEIIFPQLSRLTVQNGAGLLVNITNDAWFGNTSAAYQHFSMSVFRAIENRRSLVRVANTGISGFVDPTGRILATTTIFSDETVVENLPILFVKAIYTELGDFFILICTVVVISLFLKYSKKQLKV